MKSRMEAHGSLLHTHVACILSPFASLWTLSVVCIPRDFAARFGKMCPTRSGHIELTLRLSEPQHVHRISKRENDFIIWRTVVSQWPHGHVVVTRVRETLCVLFFVFHYGDGPRRSHRLTFSLRFSYTSRYLRVRRT